MQRNGTGELWEQAGWQLLSAIHAWAGERTSEPRAEDEGRAVAYAIVQHAGQRD